MAGPIVTWWMRPCAGRAKAEVRFVTCNTLLKGRVPLSHRLDFLLRHETQFDQGLVRDMLQQRGLLPCGTRAPPQSLRLVLHQLFEFAKKPVANVGE